MRFPIKEYFFIFEEKWAGGHQKFPGPGFNTNPPLMISNIDVLMRGAVETDSLPRFDVLSDNIQ